MAIDLKKLSPKELQTLIAGAHSQMRQAEVAQIRTLREKIDGLLKASNLALDDVYPIRGGKKGRFKKGGTGSVAPKYRDPSNPSVTWSGRGRQPIWFVEALKKRGVNAESLLISGVSKVAKVSAARKVPVKKAKKAAKPKPHN